MSREHRIHRIRYYTGRPPPADPLDRWLTGGLDAGHLDADYPPRGASAQGGLSRTPPCRYRSLLVPLDGSPFAEHALPWALGIARRAGASVRLVHVHSPLEAVYQPERLYFDQSVDTCRKRRQQAYLDGLIRRLAKVTSVPVLPALVEGREIADTLCAAAGAGADLVVMATHGRGLVGRLWHGSHADVLMRQLSVPLLLTRGYTAPVDLTSDPVLRTVLIPLDGAESSEQVLAPAFALGALTGADRILLRVIPSVPDSSVVYQVGRMQRPASEQAWAEARDSLLRLAKRWEGRTGRVHPRIIVSEEPVARAILRYAESHDADLIAVMTSRRGKLSRLFRGSVADYLARRASLPVLVLRPVG